MTPDASRDTERKAASDERERLANVLGRATSVYPPQPHECYKAADMLRADAEKDETIRRLREENDRMRKGLIGIEQFVIAATASPAPDTKDTK